MAAAVAWLLFLLIIAIALVNLAWGRRLGRSGR
jgi:ABC-type sugar transport system permease subunit